MKDIMKLYLKNIPPQEKKTFIPDGIKVTQVKKENEIENESFRKTSCNKYLFL